MGVTKIVKAMKKRTLHGLNDAELKGRRVLVRVDYNVPIEDGRVTDDTRLTATFRTLDYIRERGGRVILLSHLGRPKGKRDPEFSLEPVAFRLRELGLPVHFVAEVRGEMVRQAIDVLAPGDCALLENVRFEAGEEKDDAALGAELAALGDVYVNDAFGTAHRAHATTSALPKAMRAAGKPAVAGFLIERELKFLGSALETPDRPFVAILGGAKISGKIDVVEALLPKVDALLIGGAMANTFFRALGLEVGKSLVEPDRVSMAAELMQRAGTKLVLPVDCVVAAEPDGSAPMSVCARESVPVDQRILDIGPASVARFGDHVGTARTVLWNGPMGLFEVAKFAEGTEGVARAVAAATRRGAITVAGGGDTAAALEQAHLAEQISHVSTGGGASLEFLEGRELPGIAVLDDA
jgi:phosphoglycerate kinase